MERERLPAARPANCCEPDKASGHDNPGLCDMLSKGDYTSLTMIEINKSSRCNLGDKGTAAALCLRLWALEHPVELPKSVLAVAEVAGAAAAAAA